LCRAAKPTAPSIDISKAKLGIIKSLDLLVIDEISMVRADLLDGVDSVLRRYRRSEQPFGGVQLLMIGDLFQLPPVVREQDWQLLQPHYASPYFFSSRALGRTEMVTIELKHIYRQADNRFIDLLNRVRNNRVDPAALQKLNDRCIPDFAPDEKAGYITLSTHNRKADAINDSKLKALSPSSHRFEARIEGDFPEAIYPTAATLRLKPGAQVMFVRNDLSPERRYFNGKIGTITEIDGSEIRVRCPEDVDEILVEPATWENIEYTLNRKTMEIEESIIGTFQQIPLRLAWAITIHKSQGLTFDNAIIDAQAAFAFGQVYVALSRCRTLDGMVLSRPLAASAVKTDPVIVRFSQEALRNPPSREQLETARIQYQQRLLLECFDFGALRGLLRRTAGLILGNAKVVQASGVADIPAMQRTIEEEICAVGDSFQRQLQGLFLASTLPAADDAVLERIAKASVYFEEKIDSGPGRPIVDLQVDTDNQALKKKINNALKLLRETLAVKLAGVRSCRQEILSCGLFSGRFPGRRRCRPEKRDPQSADLYRGRHRPSPTVPDPQRMAQPHGRGGGCSRLPGPASENPDPNCRPSARYPGGIAADQGNGQTTDGTLRRTACRHGSRVPPGKGNRDGDSARSCRSLIRNPSPKSPKRSGGHQKSHPGAVREGDDPGPNCRRKRTGSGHHRGPHGPLGGNGPGARRRPGLCRKAPGHRTRIDSPARQTLQRRQAGIGRRILLRRNQDGPRRSETAGNVRRTRVGARRAVPLRKPTAQ
jgi:hypothetical protein